MRTVSLERILGVIEATEASGPCKFLVRAVVKEGAFSNGSAEAAVPEVSFSVGTLLCLIPENMLEDYQRLSSSIHALFN